VGRLIIGADKDSNTALANGSAYIFLEPEIFADGFESGDTSAWSSSAP